MTKKKLTNPIMTPKWYESLIDVCVVPSTSPIPTDTEGNVLPEPPAYRRELDEGLPVPVFLSDKTKQRERVESTAPPPYQPKSESDYTCECAACDPEHGQYGGGGLSAGAAECMDFYNRVEIWLDNDLVTKHEIGEFAESLFRLIRKGG